MKNISQSGIRAENIRAILGVMTGSDGQISRAELAAATGLSLMTVGKVADGLISEGIAAQSKPATGSAGRRAGVLSLTEKHFFLVANVTGRRYTASALDLRLSEIGSTDYLYNDTLTEEDNLTIFFRETSVFLLRLLSSHKLAGTAICTPSEKENTITSGDPCEIMKKALGFTADLVTDVLSASVHASAETLPEEDKICTMHLILDSVPCGCIASYGKKISGRADISSLACGDGKTLARLLDEEKDEEALAEKLSSALFPVLYLLSPRALFIDTASRSCTEWFPDYVKKSIASKFPSLKIYFDRKNKKGSDTGAAEMLRRMWIDKMSSHE